MIVDQGKGRPPQLNRFRKYRRVRIAAPFTCVLSPLSSRRWLRKPAVDFGVVYDLSVRGARVSTPASIKPGDEVSLTLRLPKQIRAAEITSARVRWSKGQFFGLSFTRLPASSYSRLKKFVTIAAGGDPNS